MSFRAIDEFLAEERCDRDPEVAGLTDDRTTSPPLHV
jgi:hypothetical protein